MNNQLEESNGNYFDFYSTILAKNIRVDVIFVKDREPLYMCINNKYYLFDNLKMSLERVDGVNLEIFLKVNDIDIPFEHFENKDLIKHLYEALITNDVCQISKKDIILNKIMDDGVELANGIKIVTQDCCENVYADWSQLKDTTFEETLIENLSIEKIPSSGFRINEYFVPCYNIPNGYYSDKLTLEIYFPDGSKGEIDISM